jgi:RNA polymerase sigma-70 factor, ECF subfamily
MRDDERALVEQAKSDPEAFGLLYDRYVESVFGIAVACLRNAAAAEDVTAQTFVKAFRGIGGYRDSGRPFSCWLFRIARNEVVDHVRRNAVTEEVDDALPDPAPSVEARAIDRLEVEALWRLVDRLPGQQRAAMILRFREGRTCRESGLILGKSEAAVKQLIFRAVRRLRWQVAPGGFDPGPARSALAAS